ncbi:TF-B3 domain-containing protein [Heracleum sosnowskyi]|uniref:TF-B3 domain-containing protein n=1 Tax=Heracleum sosnowskyi TaxID=360622 RepID=A0AAD8JC56_9APIA|nr:TF-B3 domain-containing protein [Heracleum sosnowskyi]
MDSSGLVCEKFVKFITRSDTWNNELRIPSDFCSKYGNRLPASFHVILRNGYRLPVDFDQRRGILKGTKCSEIEYPHIVHHLQTCHPRRVTLGNGGWRFVFFVDPTVSLVDEIEPPITFIERCGCTFPIWPRIALNNGKVFRGTYSRQTGKISCLRTMCDVLGLADLKSFHMLLFTYDGVGMVNVSVFDENLFEVVFPGSPTSIDETSQAFDIASGFKITIQPCHMLKYCYGVDISTEYKDLCNMWDRIDYINIYSGDSSWRLQVKKRNDWKRTTINDGWVEFREDLGLNVGDICSFQCCTYSYSNFTISVIKNHLNDV